MTAEQNTSDGEQPVRIASAVLCGGQSLRMRRPKHELRFGNDSALERVIRAVSEVGEPRILVLGPSQPVPALSHPVRIARDAADGLGPLAGLCAAMESLIGQADAVFLTGCDMPLLRSSFIRALTRQYLPGDEILIVEHDQRLQPLAAVYSLGLLSRIHRLIDAQQRSLHALLERSHCRVISADTLRHADPELDSLQNMNSPADYHALLQRAGLPDADISD